MAGSVPKELIMTTETNSNRPTHRVYAVIKKEGREKGTWLEIGAAWPCLPFRGIRIFLTTGPSKLVGVKSECVLLIWFAPGDRAAATTGRSVIRCYVPLTNRFS